VDVEELEWGPAGLEHQDQKQGDDREPQVIAPNHRPARACHKSICNDASHWSAQYKSPLLIGRDEDNLISDFPPTAKKIFWSSALSSYSFEDILRKLDSSPL
jgi:hypothetical protein